MVPSSQNPSSGRTGHADSSPAAARTAAIASASRSEAWVGGGAPGRASSDSEVISLATLWGRLADAFRGREGGECPRPASYSSRLRRRASPALAPAYGRGEAWIKGASCLPVASPLAEPGGRTQRLRRRYSHFSRRRQARRARPRRAVADVNRRRRSPSHLGGSCRWQPTHCLLMRHAAAARCQGGKQETTGDSAGFHSRYRRRRPEMDGE